MWTQFFFLLCLLKDEKTVVYRLRCYDLLVGVRVSAWRNLSARLQNWLQMTKSGVYVLPVMKFLRGPVWQTRNSEKSVVVLHEKLLTGFAMPQSLRLVSVGVARSTSRFPASAPSPSHYMVIATIDAKLNISSKSWHKLNVLRLLWQVHRGCCKPSLVDVLKHSRPGSQRHESSLKITIESRTSGI